MHLARRSLCRRIDARNARERGYKPRPQEPHPPHRSAVTGRRPFEGRDSLFVSEMVTIVKRCLLHGDDYAAAEVTRTSRRTPVFFCSTLMAPNRLAAVG